MTPRRIDDARGKACAGRWMRRLGLAVVSTGWLVLGACSSSAPIRYHTLAAVTAPGSARAAYDGPVLEVGSVQVPPALSRPELVRDEAAGRFEIREFDHWAAPLPRLARQALAEDLEARLPAGKVAYPDASWPPSGAVLEVDVLSFHAGSGVASMVLSWSLRQRPAAGAAPAAASLRGAQLRLETTAADGGPDATTDAWNTLLGQLADRVVADLTGSAPVR